MSLLSTYTALGNKSTVAHGNSYFTKLLCCGWGINKDMCNPLFAGDVKCCCFECAVSVNPSQCQSTDNLCAARTGCKTGPCVADLTNPREDKQTLREESKHKGMEGQSVRLRRQFEERL